MSALVELKWCGPGHDILYEGISDMFKMALGTLRDDHPRGYLITGAAKSLWASSAFTDLFSSRDHDPVELCGRRLSDRRLTIAWDDAIRGAYEHYPEAVPSGITTSTRPCDGRQLGAQSRRSGGYECQADLDGRRLAARTTPGRCSPSHGCLSNRAGAVSRIIAPSPCGSVSRRSRSGDQTLDMKERTNSSGRRTPTNTSRTSAWSPMRWQAVGPAGDECDHAPRHASCMRPVSSGGSTWLLHV
jgi:hypothetical protein